MSINAHKNLVPSTLDDVENLLNTCMYLSNIELPWDNIDVVSFQKNNVIMELKENFDIHNLCNDEFEFFHKFFLI